MERKKLTRRVGVIAALIAVMVLAACDTQPATNVTESTATLNAKGACTSGTSGQWWYQVRNASQNGGWYDATARSGYSCTANTGEVNFDPRTVGGLSPGLLYQFRLAVTVNGEYMWFDSAGTKNGGSYDSFRTRDIAGKEDQSSNPPQENDCSSDGTTACGSAAIGTYPNYKKIGLTNKMQWVFGNGTPAEFKIADARAIISWGYNVEKHTIRWIDKKSAWGCQLGGIPGSVCEYEGGQWIVSYCDRDGLDQCLFRHEDKIYVSFTFKIGFSRHLLSCEGTRIWADLGQNHRRNAYEGECNANPLAKLDRSRPPVRNQDLTVGKGKNAVKVGRYLNRHQLDEFDIACLSKSATVRKCKRIQLKLYRGLPDSAKAKIKRGQKTRPTACAALSPDALDRLHPGTPCASRT
jgi:hypothetical protein